MINFFFLARIVKNEQVQNSLNCDNREAGNWSGYLSESSQTHSDKGRLDFLSLQGKNELESKKISVGNLKEKVPRNKRPKEGDMATIFLQDLGLALVARTCPRRPQAIRKAKNGPYFVLNKATAGTPRMFDFLNMENALQNYQAKTATYTIHMETWTIYCRPFTTFSRNERSFSYHSEIQTQSQTIHIQICTIKIIIQLISTNRCIQSPKQN